MNFPNKKNKTIKIPRERITESDKELMLDVLLACAYPHTSPTNNIERRGFEQTVLNAPDEEMSTNVKRTLASLSEGEKGKLLQ